MNATEGDIRRELGIPDCAKKVIILDQASHMDWDWLQTFEGYYTTTANFDGFDVHAVRQILSEATECLNNNKAAKPPYYYSLAEIGYLQKFASDQPDKFSLLQGVGHLFRIVGGGITSPDNLLCHGEAILRNFLVGNTWVKANFPATSQNGLPPLPPLRQVWIPDDFGHDSQFPILVEAMGLMGAGFSRIPGDPQQCGSLNTSSDIASGQLISEGVDFIWQASDGSSTLAHWMQAGYFQGNSIQAKDPVSSILDTIQGFYNSNAPTAPTDYIYVPIDLDFCLPYKSLLQYVAAWNAQYCDAQCQGMEGDYQGVFAVVATFDHYLQLVNFHRDRLKPRAYHAVPDADPLKSILPFQSTPYWTGFYASRPANKILHHAATQALLGAEVFGVIADYLFGLDSSHQTMIDQGWSALTPSTHHDYVTGTAANTPDYAVYNGEQIPLLTRALALGNEARAAPIEKLSSMVSANPVSWQNSGVVLKVVVFNQLGFTRGGLVEMDAVPGFAPAAFGTASEVLGPVQLSAEGRWLFIIPYSSGVPSLGYNTYYLTTEDNNQPPQPAIPNSPQEPSGDDSIILSNDFLSATLSKAGNWGITGLEQLMTTSDPAPMIGGTANDMLFYNDGGTLYKFGNEVSQEFSLATTTFQPTFIKVLESGPVRQRVQIEGNYQISGESQAVKVRREYSLVADEPFLRLTTTASAPNPYSVFVKFPFTTSVDEILHGTPYHWDWKPAQPIYNTEDGWIPPIFEATHDFVIAIANDKQQGAIYHSHLPAWAVDVDGSLMCCLMRNPTAQGHSGIPAVPGDPDPHTVKYALRLPSTETPASGAQLRESLSYQVPLLARLATGFSEGTFTSLPDSYCLASSSNGPAIITAAKNGTVPGETVGDLVLRIYQPSNQALDVTLTLQAAQAQTVRGITALELPLESAAQAALDIKVGGNQITFNAQRALTTLAIRKRPRTTTTN